VIPATHHDLSETALPAMLVTLMQDGRPQASVVWFDYFNEVFRVNSERGRLKVRNMERDPRVTLLIVDPKNQHRYLEVRGDVVSVEEDGALEHRAHLDALYLGPDHRTDPSNDQSTRVIVSIKPEKVVAYG
jgi:PPOX class probable F420-dependent enzyme